MQIKINIKFSKIKTYCNNNKQNKYNIALCIDDETEPGCFIVAA